MNVRELLVVLLLAVVALGLVARRLGIPYPVLFVLGAVVSPTDEVAVLAVAQRLPIPHQALAIVSSEALFNDATALVAYRFALTATISGTFSLEAASLRFVAVVVG